MNAPVSQDPLVLVVLGFCLAMAVVAAILVAFRAGRTPVPGVTPIPIVYPVDDTGERLKVGCFLSLLLIVVIAILAALSAG